MGSVSRQLSIACVGADFPNKRGPTRRFEIAICAPGEMVDLDPDPKNKADQNAIKVMSARGVQLGYVAAERTSLIHRAWSDGNNVRAIFQRKSDFGCWIRVSLDESDPILPPEPPAPPASAYGQTPPTADPDSGFWPDFLPNDD